MGMITLVSGLYFYPCESIDIGNDAIKSVVSGVRIDYLLPRGLIHCSPL